MLTKENFAEYEIYSKSHTLDDSPTYVTLQGSGLNAKFIEHEDKPLNYRTITLSRQLTSQIPKMLITVDTAFYHSILDQISAMVHFHRQFGYHNLVFVLFRTENAQIDSFFVKFMRDQLYDYVVLDNLDGTTIEVKNFFYTNYFKPTEHGIDEMSKVYRAYAKNPGEAPTKKVYLSRKRVVSSDPRIDDETVVEDYFREKGFEVVSPEDFKSMPDQIDYMSQVKVLATISGSGLLNQLFMQNGQEILSLDSGMASQFTKLSHTKQHNIVTIPHKKVASELVQYLDSLPYMQTLLRS